MEQEYDRQVDKLKDEIERQERKEQAKIQLEHDSKIKRYSFII